jgi:hypothetical protein
VALVLTTLLALANAGPRNWYTKYQKACTRNARKRFGLGEAYHKRASVARKAHARPRHRISATTSLAGWRGQCRSGFKTSRATAFVGIAQTRWPGSARVWPIDTTSLSTDHVLACNGIEQIAMRMTANKHGDMTVLIS